MGKALAFGVVAIIAVVALAMMASCSSLAEADRASESVSETADSPIDCVRITRGLSRCIDEAADVVCWYSIWNGRPALSCLPMDQTGLIEGR